jgi:MFS-type transporter involved in bile tolerance (Atg22 family)
MNYVIILDKRFKFDSLTSIESKSAIIPYLSYERWEIVVLIYIILASCLSIFIVLYDSFELVKGALDKEV